jgi:hypothetical protein
VNRTFHVGRCAPLVPVEYNNQVAFRLDGEYLMPPGHGLPCRKPEDLAGRSPNLDLLAVFIPKSQQRSFHGDGLLFRGSGRSSPPRSYSRAGDAKKRLRGGAA